MNFFKKKELTDPKHLNGTVTVTVRFFMFIKEDSSAHQACIYLIQSTAKIFLLFKMNVFYLNIFLNVIYSFDFKGEF